MNKQKSICLLVSVVFLSCMLSIALPVNASPQYVTTTKQYFPLYGYGTFINFNPVPVSFNSIYFSGTYWYFDDIGLQMSGANLTVTQITTTNKLLFTLYASGVVSSTVNINMTTRGDPSEVKVAGVVASEGGTWSYSLGIMTGTWTVTTSLTIEITWTGQVSLTFSFLDFDGNTMQSTVDWTLYDGVNPVTYTQGQQTLSPTTTYTLVSSYKGTFVNTTSLDMATYGNTIVPIRINAKPQLTVANGYIVFNDTITSVAVTSETPTDLAFTAAGAASGYTIIADVPSNATSLMKNGIAYTSWTYDSGNEIITITTATLSTWELTFSSGNGNGNGNGGSTYSLTVQVTNLGVPIQGAQVTLGALSRVSNSNGTSVFAGLVSGNYNMTVIVAGQVKGQYVVTITGNSQMVVDIGTKVWWLTQYVNVIAAAVIILIVSSAAVIYVRIKRKR